MKQKNVPLPVRGGVRGGEFPPPALPPCGGRNLAFVGVLVFVLCTGVSHAAETIIKGGRMEMINKGETVVFTDGVKLDRGTDRMESQEMRTNQSRDKVFVKGNVRLQRNVSSTESWKGYGDSGYYSTSEGSGYLLGSKKQQAKVVRTEILTSTSSRIITVVADRIDFFRDAKKAYAKGSVYGTTVDPENGEKYDFWSEEADFDGTAKKIVLSGPVQPLVIQTAGASKRTLRGDKIVYFTEEKRMYSEGKSRAVFNK